MENKMNMFETALRNKYRYTTIRGIITTEQLWDLKLESADGFNLDTVARGINANLKEISEESFVKPSSNSDEKVELETKLEIVKYIIAVKLEEKTAAARRRERTEERRKLLDAIGAKKDAQLTEASLEELERKLAALD